MSGATGHALGSPVVESPKSPELEKPSAPDELAAPVELSELVEDGSPPVAAGAPVSLPESPVLPLVVASSGAPVDDSSPPVTNTSTSIEHASVATARMMKTVF